MSSKFSFLLDLFAICFFSQARREDGPFSTRFGSVRFGSGAAGCAEGGNGERGWVVLIASMSSFSRSIGFVVLRRPSSFVVVVEGWMRVNDGI